MGRGVRNEGKWEDDWKRKGGNLEGGEVKEEKKLKVGYEIKKKKPTDVRSQLLYPESSVHLHIC